MNWKGWVECLELWSAFLTVFLSSFSGMPICKVFGVTTLWTRILHRKKFFSTTGLPCAVPRVYVKQEESNVKGILNFSWGKKKKKKTTLGARVSVFSVK